ncbi:MAG: S-layer homology domain-containing protein, partial [Clostridia bacterium]|nr:S-layer homology domain-containing protein [Clostridia bacterium]
MKNLKKVLALVVVFAMMLSTVAFAGSFPDVADDADYASAIETLAAMGFFKGDDNGNFNPDATITRAEYAVIVCRLLGIEGSATGKCDFTDAADHWATGYIKMANQYGIVKGYGDGNFGPDDAVKYEEAVKMLVCALGYEPMAASKGGYPTGYIAVASQIGLLDSVSGATQGTGAARNIVATMTYNALDIPVMEQVGFGTEISYEIMKKNDDHDKSTLLTKMGIYKLGGTIVANSKVSYKASVEKVDAGKVYFICDDDYDCPESALAFKTNQSTRNHTFEVGDTNAEDFVATKVILYVSKVSGKWTIQSVELDTDATDTLTIKASDLNDAENKVDASPAYLRYYKDGVTSGDGTKVNLASDFTATWNNTQISVADLKKELTSNVSATVEFIDWDNDNKYDIVKVFEYVHLIAQEVKADKGIVETYDGTKVDFDIDNDDAVVSIKDENGKALEISDIADGDVLALLIGAKSGNDFRAKTAYVKNANYDSLDVVVLKNSTVTGAVKEYDASYEKNPTTNNDELSDLTINVDGKDYDVAVNDNGFYQLSKIDLQAEGTFYIGINGEIVGFEGDKITSDNYGLILSSYTSSNKSTAPQVTIMTKEGKEVTYDFASSVRFV